jgi:hypothetical protein
LAIVDPEIRLGLGGERGLDTFKQQWQPSRASSKFWNQLGLILSLGGTFEIENGEKNYCAPYITTRWRTLVQRFPAFGNAADYAVLLRNNVALRSRPSVTAPAIKILSFEVVRLAHGSTTSKNRLHWIKVKTLDGRLGYIRARDMRSPIDYSACFKKVNGQWRMVSFIAGD